METVTLIGRLLVSLAAVLGLMWVIARRVKRTGTGRSAALVDVLSRRQLSRTASVAVVRVQDKALILGITDGQVSLIGETDLAAAERTVQQGAPRRTPRPGPARATTRGAARGPAHGSARGLARGSARPNSVDLSTRIGPDGRILPAQRRQPNANGAFAGSALSPATWRQTFDSLRNLTTRS
jgi:flagellar protein FliO/FliZ